MSQKICILYRYTFSKNKNKQGRNKMLETKTGTVKWFNNQKGYGFITPSTGGKDLFVHMSSIQMEGYKTLSENQSVGYQVETSDRGPVATNVTV